MTNHGDPTPLHGDSSDSGEIDGGSDSGSGSGASDGGHNAELRALLDLVRGMPKAELHIHIEGSLEPELIFALAKRNGVALPYASVEALRQAYAFDDLQSFLDIYYAGTSVLFTEQDFYDMTWQYLLRAHADNILHTELFFDPQSHLSRGVGFAAIIGGIARALRDAAAAWGMTGALIMCFLRHLSEDDAFATLELALPYRASLVGVGLDSSERDHPPEKFARVFARCRDLGLRLVAHAGEEGPPAYIRSALDVLRVERIDHGVRCLEDPALVTVLKARRTPLTVCPLSNVKLKVVDDMARHPLRALLDAGLMVTINSDDPAYFGGYLSDNFVAIFAALPMTSADAFQLANDSFNAAFLDDATKAAYRAKLRRYVQGWHDRPAVRVAEALTRLILPHENGATPHARRNASVNRRAWRPFPLGKGWMRTKR